MQNNIREINVKEIISRIKFLWKKIIIAGIIVGFAAGLIFWIMTLPNDEKPEHKQEQEQETSVDISEGNTEVKEKELEEWQKVEAEQLLYYYNKMFYYDMYIKDSIVFNLREFLKDYKLTYVGVEFYVSLDNNSTNGNLEQNQKNVLALYMDYVNSVEFAQQLKDLLYKDKDVKIEHIQDLVMVKNSGSKLYVYVCITEAGSEQQLKEFIKRSVEEKNKLYKTHVKHNIVVITESVETVTSDHINTKLMNIKSQLSETKSQLNSNLEKLSLEQKKYLRDVLWQYNYSVYASNLVIPENDLSSNVEENTEENIEENTEENIEQNTEVKNAEADGMGIKKIFIGAIAGILVVTAIYVLKFLFSGKIQFADDMLVCFNLYQFGTVRIVDENCSEQIESVCESIKLYCERNNIEKLLIYSGLSLLDTTQIGDIKDKLKKYQIKVEMASYEDDANRALKEATEYGNVIFVEAVDKSKYRSIELELEKMNKYNINVLGSVVLSKY